MNVIQVPEHLKGFDCNTPVSYNDARKFVDAGYRFCMRYVPRVMTKPGDLTPEEYQGITKAGLAIMPVQHVESESTWDPTPAKGTQYGIIAAAYAQACGIMMGCNLWLDLEGVNVTADRDYVVQYCNNWYKAVASKGFTPGLYVGWHPGLTPSDLYSALSFEHYWAAYNLNSDQYPAVRGVQMRQHSGKAPDGISYEIDTDTVQKDNFGMLPLACVPDEWDV